MPCLSYSSPTHVTPALGYLTDVPKLSRYSALNDTHTPTKVTPGLSGCLIQLTPDKNSLPLTETRSKRKSFSLALERIPKLARNDSLVDSEDGSPANSQQLLMSQGSNFSVSSEAETEKRLEKFNEVISCITMLDPVLGSAISSPIDLHVQARTLQR